MDAVKIGVLAGSIASALAGAAVLVMSLALARELGLELTRVGAIQAGPARLQVLDRDGRPLPVPPGFDHFAG